MPVYRLDLAYDGSGFRGYAIQNEQRTVQGELERAIGVYLKQHVATAVAGRTDAGVHARGQVVSFPFDGEVEPRRFLRALNGILGPEITIRSISEAEAGFNARFSAVWRRYRYLLDTGSPDPLNRGFVWQTGRSLDIAMMKLAAVAVVGEHDFGAFCRSVGGKSNVRRLVELSLNTHGDTLTFWVQANSFCQQMVRSIVGYLYDVGRGYTDGSFAEEIIANRDRSRVTTVAPPHGLTLWEVGYP